MPVFSEPRSLRLRRALVNPPLAMLLRSPAHRVLSGSHLLLSYTGCRSGRRRTLPVMYAREGDRVLVLAGRPEGKRWWRNFRKPSDVEVVVAGERRRGRGRLLAGAERDEALAAYLARFPRGGRALGVHARDPAALAEAVRRAAVVEVVLDERVPTAAKSGRKPSKKLADGVHGRRVNRASRRRAGEVPEP